MTEREEIIELLSAYIDGELNKAEIKRVEQTLAADSDLAAELQRLRATSRLVRNLPWQAAPAGFVSRVQLRAERQQLIGAGHAETQTKPLRWVRYLAVAAVLLVAVGVGVLITVTPWSIREPAVYTADKITEGDDVGVPGAMASRATPEERAEKAEEATLRESGASYKSLDESSRRETKEGKRVTELPSLAKGGAPAGRDIAEPATPAPAEVAPADRMEIAAKVAAAETEDRLRTKEGGPSPLNVEIYTDDLAAAQQEVEGLFLANSIQPYRLPASAMAKQADEVRSRANFYQANQITPSQVQYVAFVSSGQIGQLQTDLETIRSKQKVAQGAKRILPDLPDTGKALRADETDQEKFLAWRRAGPEDRPGRGAARDGKVLSRRAASAPVTQPVQREILSGEVGGKAEPTRIQQMTEQVQPPLPAASQQAGAEVQPVVVTLNLVQIEPATAPAAGLQAAPQQAPTTSAAE